MHIEKTIQYLSSFNDNNIRKAAHYLVKHPTHEALEALINCIRYVFFGNFSQKTYEEVCHAFVTSADIDVYRKLLKMVFYELENRSGGTDATRKLLTCFGKYASHIAITPLLEYKSRTYRLSRDIKQCVEDILKRCLKLIPYHDLQSLSYLGDFRVENFSKVTYSHWNGDHPDEYQFDMISCATIRQTAQLELERRI